jgi:hypothetical protein
MNNILSAVNLESVIAVIALATAIINHFRVSNVNAQVKAELKNELTTFKAELKADAILAAASVLADALVAGAKLKADAKTVAEARG